MEKTVIYVVPTTFISKEDKGITFTVQLPAGQTKLQTWFLDQNNKTLCGAYYVYVERK